MITLKTLPDATAQEVFDQVASHLLSQMKVSWTGNGCAYRGDGGLQCAAGCLIGDDEYDIKFEENPWDSLVIQGEVPGNHRELICDLQSVHDTFLVTRWHASLSDICSSHNLSPAILNECL